MVRGLMRVYRPMLTFFLDHPGGIVWFVGLTFVLAAAPIGSPWGCRLVVAGAVLASVWMTRNTFGKWAAALTLIFAGLAAEQWMTPLPREFIAPLDEGMVMDMPITVPRMSATQASDDLKARDMIFCRFPEVDMVVGKAGRAETATDPAPLDMIETMINFRPREFWPRRCMRPADAERQARAVLEALAERKLIADPGPPDARHELALSAAMETTALFDAQMREAAYQRNREFERDLGRVEGRFAVERLIQKLDDAGTLSRPDAERGLAPLVDQLIAGHAEHLAMGPTSEAVAELVRDVLRKLVEAHAVQSGADLLRRNPGLLQRGWERFQSLLGGESPTFYDDLTDALRVQHLKLWREHTRRLNAELRDRAAELYTRLVLESLLAKTEVIDEKVKAAMLAWHRARYPDPNRAPLAGRRPVNIIIMAA